MPADGELELNKGAKTLTLTVANTGDRPVQVGSHYHFAETNSALDFDRKKALGTRLDIPSGTAVRFEPGQTREVTLVPFGGKREGLWLQSRRHGENLMSDWIQTLIFGFIGVILFSVWYRMIPARKIPEGKPGLAIFPKSLVSGQQPGKFYSKIAGSGI